MSRQRVNDWIGLQNQANCGTGFADNAYALPTETVDMTGGVASRAIRIPCFDFGGASNLRVPKSISLLTPPYFKSMLALKMNASFAPRT